MTNVVITGSTQGIGYGLAAEFCHRGDNVTIAGRDQQKLAQALDNLKNASGQIAGITCDVTQAEEVQALWNHAFEQFGTVDIWINNAGLARTAWNILEVPQREIEAMIRTNMLGTINGSRVAATGMKAGGQGKIFNMLGGGSDGEYFPGMGIYGTTKRGLDYFTDAIAKEMAGDGVIIGKIRPGMIITEAVVREAREDIASFKKSRQLMNNLVDTIETVAPFLVDRIMATKKSGTKIRWLTGSKIAKRMMMSRLRKRPDQFEAFGL
ncbi:MAG: NAD(P)-dependent dehydrogenase (short-subunit alcohol dehydrogenase family) [Halieaceae bacterium]|jgi:NAD(P)-dependent dehydrogenase (short-subunit alcohol dehydrogenase family)